MKGKITYLKYYLLYLEIYYFILYIIFNNMLYDIILSPALHIETPHELNISSHIILNNIKFQI
jgi:hypothetical protein